MKQPSPTEQNGTTAPTGVTAVLDSMIRTTDQRERAAEKPLTSAPAASVSVDVRTPTSPGPRAKATGTPAAKKPQAPAKATLPEPARQIRFSDHAHMGHPMWSIAGATALGLPARFLEAFDGLRDGDEAAWISTMVKLVSPMCTGAPDRPTMLIASEMNAIPDAIGLPVHRPGSLPPYGGSIFCTVDDSEVHFEWLRRVRGDRDLHVMLNGKDTDWLVYDTPGAVSYTNARGALEALKLAESTGAAIAFGTNAEGAPIRVTALELTLAIRSLFRTR